MKKITIYLLIFIYLFSFTEVKQFLKLPNFIEHYQEHKSDDNSISIIEFIVLHYFSKKIKDTDYQDDMKLPFKTHDFSCHNFTIQDLPKIFELSFSEIYYLEKKNKNFHYFLNFTEGNSFSFYPPPKFV